MFNQIGLQAMEYLRDAQERSILFMDVMRQRGDQYVEHARAGKPPVLVFDHELIVDGRELPNPVNYALLRIVPPADMPTNPATPGPCPARGSITTKGRASGLVGISAGGTIRNKA